MQQLPCWCLFFLGLFMYLNFHQVGGEHIYLYYPVVLVGLSVVILFNPTKTFYFRTRMWLLYSLVCTPIPVDNAIANYVFSGV
jgi:hypothetical protein